MASFNKVILMGNLTRDVEIRQAATTGMKIGRFGIATNERRRQDDGTFKEYPCFVDIEVWDKLADLCGRYLSKGRPVLVEGRLQMDQWEKDGQRHTKLKVRASTIKFVGAPPAAAGSVPAPPPAEPVPPAADSEDIPF